MSVTTCENDTCLLSILLIIVHNKLAISTVCPTIKTLNILLTTKGITTDLFNFSLVKQIYNLTIHRLSG